MVNFAIRNDPRGRLRFAPLQSPAGQRLLQSYGVAPDADTVVLIDRGKTYTYARAAIRISRYFRWPARMLYAFRIVPDFISQPLYRFIARKRYAWFGKKDQCMVPAPAVRSRFLSE